MNKHTLQKDITVIVADDHPIFRRGLSSALRTFSFVKKISEAKDGSELLKRLETNSYDVVFLDVVMPLIDGEAAARVIHEKYPDVRVIVMSMCDDIHIISRLYAAGCHGYLVKNADEKEIKKAMNAVLSGQKYFDNFFSEKITLEQIDKHNHINHMLSVSEMKLIPLLCAEKSNKEIAKELQLSIRTIENHKYHIYSKTGVKNVNGLIKYAMSHRLV